MQKNHHTALQANWKLTSVKQSGMEDAMQAVWGPTSAQWHHEMKGSSVIEISHPPKDYQHSGHSASSDETGMNYAAEREADGTAVR